MTEQQGQNDIGVAVRRFLESMPTGFEAHNTAPAQSQRLWP